MVRLGPIREEACAVLAVARFICEGAGEYHAARHVRVAVCAIRSVELPNPRDLLETAESFDPWVAHEDTDSWIQNVSKFCADILRWTHEEERRRERFAIDAIGGLTVPMSEHKQPTRVGWMLVARALSELLGYDVQVGDGVTLRHMRISFDGRFLLTWTEQKKFVDF